MQEKWSVGIDEAGRGPLAGPVAVGVVKVPVDFVHEIDNIQFVEEKNVTDTISHENEKKLFQQRQASEII